MATPTLTHVPKVITSRFGPQTSFSTFKNTYRDGMDLCTRDGYVLPTQEDVSITQQAMYDFEKGDNTVTLDLSHPKYV